MIKSTKIYINKDLVILEYSSDLCIFHISNGKQVLLLTKNSIYELLKSLDSLSNLKFIEILKSDNTDAKVWYNILNNVFYIHTADNGTTYSFLEFKNSLQYIIFINLITAFFYLNYFEKS